MPIRVQVPGHGVVEFPDGTAEQEMLSALNTLTASEKAPEPEKPAAGGFQMMGDVLVPAGQVDMQRDANAIKTAATAGVDFVKNNPAPIGATIGGALAAPLTGGMSLLPAMAVAGGASAAGAAAGNAVAGRPVDEGVVGQGVMGAAGPVAGKAMSAAGDFFSRKALPTVRAALKPAVSSLRQQAGASIEGIDGVANRVASIILRNRWSKPEHAMAAVKEGEKMVQSALANAPADTVLDIPQRLPRYLQNLQQSAGGQASPGRDLGAIKSAAEGVMEGPLARDITQQVAVPSRVLGANGQPVMTTEQQVVGRELRDNVSPAEGLTVARLTGRWGNRKAWGELKGAEQEVSKATERALRDSVKQAVKPIRPGLKMQHEAFTALPFLDQMTNRMANRDIVGLPAWLNIAAPGTATAKVGGGLLANSVAKNQLRAGFGLDSLGSMTTNAAKPAESLTPVMLRAIMLGLLDGSPEVPQDK